MCHTLARALGHWFSSGVAAISARQAGAAYAMPCYAGVAALSS